MDVLFVFYSKITNYSVWSDVTWYDAAEPSFDISIAADDCGIKTFPFSEGFSSYPYGSTAAFPECWNKFSSSTTYPHLLSSGYSDANSMYFYKNSGTAHCMLITPLIDANISLLRVSFAFYSTFAAKFEIGVMTDPTDLIPI